MPRNGDLARRLAVARGDEPADLVVRGGRVLSVFTREWLEADVAICDGTIAGLGRYEGAETLDAAGSYVVPGFIDAHMHLETSKLLPSEFARLVLPLGTTAVVADPHEIANVLGTDGVHWLVDVCDDLPLDVFFTASSCVPASQFESPHRPFTTGDLESLLRRKRVIGLAEMMNFPGVIGGDRKRARQARRRRSAPRRRPRAGRSRPRAPGVRRRGHPLGPRGVHAGGRPRAPAGRPVAPHPRGVRGAEPAGAGAARRRVRAAPDGLLHRRPRARAHREDGHINAIVRDAVSLGVSPEDALTIASHHPALWHGLDHLGAVAPGYQADLLVLPDLERFVPALVLKSGRAVEGFEPTPVPEWVRQSVRLRAVSATDFAVPWEDGRPA